MGDHAFNVDAVRAQFPALHQDVNGTPLVYLDNAASSQVPQCVIDALVKHYAEDRSNVHRAVHTLSQRATAGFDAGREKVARFLGASSAEEIVKAVIAQVRKGRACLLSDLLIHGGRLSTNSN